MTTAKPQKWWKQEVVKMAENEEIVTWDEALSGGAYVKFDQDPKTKEYAEKILKIVNWTLVKCEKFGKKDIVEFRSDVLEEDGEKVVEKSFTTTSNRLKTKLKNLLTNRDATIAVTINVMPIGDDFARQYSLKEVKSE